MDYQDFDTLDNEAKEAVSQLVITSRSVVYANGSTIQDILGDYEYLEEEDIIQALRYAAWAASDQIIAV